MKLSALSCTDLLAAFRSPEPTPGGGSASALAGAVGASLLAMVARLARPRAATSEDAARLEAAGARCAGISERLSELMDRDSDAYHLVVARFRLPKRTDDEHAARGISIQEALRAATETPLDVMRACNDAIGQAAVVAAFGNRHASSDVQVGLDLLGAGVRGAKLNVDVNLGSITDADFVTASRGDARRLAADGETGIARARARLEEA